MDDNDENPILLDDGKDSDDNDDNIDDYDYDRDYIFYDNDEEEDIDEENDENNVVNVEDFDKLVTAAKKWFWRPVGSNFGNRNFASCRSSFYAKQGEQNQLKRVANATGQQKITKFINGYNQGDDDDNDIYDLILKCEEYSPFDNSKIESGAHGGSFPKYSRRDAIENLLKEEAKVTRDVSREKKMGLAHHEIIQAMAIVRYFQRMEDGENKLVASENVAENLYQTKIKRGSYKSRCIRRWADNYLETGE